MAGKVCAIVGFGPGLGAAYADRFAAVGYDLVLISRSGAKPKGASAGGGVRAYACDAGNTVALTETLGAAEREAGPIDVLIYNADLARFGTLDEITEAEFEGSWRVGVLGLFTAAKWLAPRMAERNTGAIVVSGATAALRGNVWTTAFAPTKAAQRNLSQSLAKQLGPKGIHVIYMVIDGVIDTAGTRANFAPEAPDDFFIQPSAIADTALMLVGQDRSAWTFEVDLRPFGEKW